jgi:NAD/NADP transhydrogenase alpha subunit
MSRMPAAVKPRLRKICAGRADVDAPRFGADRTAVRKLNHGSILADLAAERAGNAETRQSPRAPAPRRGLFVVQPA